MIKWFQYKADNTCRQIFKMSKKYLYPDILDIGAGSGALVKYLRVKGYDARGIDLQSDTWEVQIADAREIEIDNEYMTIFMCDFLEHVEDVKAVLKTAYRGLENDGVLIVIVPYKEDMNLSMTQCPDCGKTFHRNYHYWSFTPDGLAGLLIEAGFEIEKVKVIDMHTKYSLGWPFAWLSRKMGLSNSIFMVGRK